eukprot:248137-Prymnesium_polylepis.1
MNTSSCSRSCRMSKCGAAQRGRQRARGRREGRGRADEGPGRGAGFGRGQIWYREGEEEAAEGRPGAQGL